MSELLSAENRVWIKKFDDNTKWLSDHYEEIKHQYTNKIVVVDNGNVIDFDEDINNLLSRLREKYKDIRHFVIQYISDKHYPII